MKTNTLYRVTTCSVLVAAMLMSVTLFSSRAQEQPKEAKVELKAEVALELKSIMLDSAQTQIRMSALSAEYSRLQNEQLARYKDYQAKVATALERSGLDKDKYEVNHDTLAVTPKLAAPKDQPKDKK